MNTTITAWIGSAALALLASVVITDEYHTQHPTQLVINQPPAQITRVEYGTDWWMTLINIESAGGQNTYRPQNTSGTCANRVEACGVHQLTKIALQDLDMCKTRISQCMKDRDDFQQSQVMANAYAYLLIHRYKCNPKQGHLKYVCWNQGPSAVKIFSAVTKGTKLGDAVLKNMANNSAYSFNQLKNWGSKKAATKFLEYRRIIWNRKKVNT